MCGMRSFDSVPTCSGWVFSHRERFRPFRMTIWGSGRVFIWEILCVFWNYRCYITIRVGPWRRVAPKAQDGSTRRCERLCEAIRLPPVIPTEVEGSFLQTGKTWVRERRNRKWHLNHQSLVTPTIRGKESSHMRGMRSFGLVPHLFWRRLFTHRAFSFAQDDDTRGRKGSHRIGRMNGEFIFPIAAFL